MISFLIFCAVAVICVAILGALWWALESTPLPQPLKVCILVVLAMVGLIYFLQSGTLPELGRR